MSDASDLVYNALIVHWLLFEYEDDLSVSNEFKSHLTDG